METENKPPSTYHTNMCTPYARASRLRLLDKGLSGSNSEVIFASQDSRRLPPFTDSLRTFSARYCLSHSF